MNIKEDSAIAILPKQALLWRNTNNETRLNFSIDFAPTFTDSATPVADKLKRAQDSVRGVMMQQYKISSLSNYQGFEGPPTAPRRGMDFSTANPRAIAQLIHLFGQENIEVKDGADMSAYIAGDKTQAAQGKPLAREELQKLLDDGIRTAISGVKTPATAAVRK
jgi:hypothetical protein